MGGIWCWIFFSHGFQLAFTFKSLQGFKIMTYILYRAICDRIWENPAYSEFYEFLVSYIFDKLYHRANLPYLQVSDRSRASRMS